MIFYGIVFAIIAVIAAIASLYCLDDGKKHAAGTAILIALVCGGVSMNHFETSGELKQAYAQAKVLKQDLSYQTGLATKYKREHGAVVSTLADTNEVLRETKAAMAKAKGTLETTQRDLNTANNEIAVLKAELKAAKETTQVDRDRMLLLEQENTELRSTLADIQEAVR